jgi:hypothetical protein
MQKNFTFILKEEVYFSIVGKPPSSLTLNQNESDHGGPTLQWCCVSYLQVDGALYNPSLGLGTNWDLLLLTEYGKRMDVSPWLYY